MELPDKGIPMLAFHRTREILSSHSYRITLYRPIRATRHARSWRMRKNIMTNVCQLRTVATVDTKLLHCIWSTRRLHILQNASKYLSMLKLYLYKQCYRTSQIKRCISWIWCGMKAVFRTSTATTLTDVFVSFHIVSRQISRYTMVLSCADWDNDCIVKSITHRSTSGVRCGPSATENVKQHSHVEQAWTNKRASIYMFGVHPFRKRWYRIASKQYHSAVIKEKCNRKWTHQPSPPVQ